MPTHEDLVDLMSTQLRKLDGFAAVACAAALLADVSKREGYSRAAVVAAFHNAWDRTERTVE